VSPPSVYVGDESGPIRLGVSDKLRADGIHVYTPSSRGDPERDTASIGGFKCALLHLDRLDGKADAIDFADLLRVYQPTLPVAFLHETAPEPMLRRARVVGPVFKIPDDLEAAHEWARDQAKR